MKNKKFGENKIKEKTNDNKKVLGSSRLTSFFSQEQNKTIVVTILFWSDGTVTWVGEE